MLTRVEKKAYIPGWTLATDSSYTLNFTQPARFADDGNISGYAKASVYFMNAKGVINGTGNNMFSPAVTATRQEALIIAARMVDNLKGKALDYTGGTTQPPENTQPPSGGLNADEQELVGTWSGYYKGFSLYYEFRADGTFSYSFMMYSDHYYSTYGYGQWYLWVGKWSKSGNTVYMTQIKQESWFGDNSERDDSTRGAIDDCTMNIEMREPDDSSSTRYFINHSVVIDDWSPRLQNEPNPDWLYLGY